VSNIQISARQGEQSIIYSSPNLRRKSSFEDNPATASRGSVADVDEDGLLRAVLGTNFTIFGSVLLLERACEGSEINTDICLPRNSVPFSAKAFAALSYKLIRMKRYLN
jgi:hypothetical protein